MEVLLSAVASDLVGRLISFLISKFPERGSTDDVVRLQRSLLRARAVVEKAEARQVTSRAMLLQLNQLRGEMCRGTYVLDAFRRRAVLPGRRSHATARRSLGLLPGSDAAGELSVAVESMEAALGDMKELVVLLGGCPRVSRQPYSAYLFMESCMFGRQMEKEQIVSFLLQPARDLDVLPIIGPREVGKRTLVEHACLEERVRDHFAKIHRLCGDDLDVQGKEPLRGVVDTAQRSLIVIDFAGGDTDEERWRGFRSSLRRRAQGESKIIVISRAETHSGGALVPVQSVGVRRRRPGGAPGARARRHGAVRGHPGPHAVRRGDQDRRVAPRRPERSVLAPRAEGVPRGDGAAARRRRPWGSWSSGGEGRVLPPRRAGEGWA
ncbi:hypothetical protein GQ55_5G430300 [Panicum hallii var. hallii]|uniref:Disease resistance N-terminal domain-containing protein n=1 Tax=Panicum hallii var. hallii TaxID=1504633 RepID=A0A2T7DPC5_9POAL|nr:hypothetical protein GQ55_5G430300 [Panicum hallii var. hallii]